MTSDVIDDFKLEAMADRIDNVRGERNTLNVVDIRQGATLYWMDDIKEEGESPNPENTRESFISDSVDVKVEDTYDYVCDIKEENVSQNMDNIERSLTFENINIKVEDTYDYVCDIKEENVSQNMDNIERSLTFENINIKVEDTYDYISDTKKEGVSQIMDLIRENSTCNNIDIKVEDHDVCMDDTNIKEMSYNHDGIEQQEHEEGDRKENTGSLFLFFSYKFIQSWKYLMTLYIGMPVVFIRSPLIIHLNWTMNFLSCNLKMMLAYV